MLAFVLFKSGKRKSIDHDKGLRIWEVIIGEVPAENESQQAYADGIERLYLNWFAAPESYKQRYPRKYAYNDDDTPVVVQGTDTKHWSDI